MAIDLGPAHIATIIEVVDERIENRMTVYVALLTENVEVYRPVEAERVGDDLYRLIGERPDDEVWPFSPGEVVRCQTRTLAGNSARLGPVLVACERLK